MVLYKKVILSILCLHVSMFAKEFSLDELVEIALSKNSNIKISKYKEQNKEANYQTSQSAYLPKVYLEGEIAHYDVEVASDTVSSVTLGASQLLYDFGKTSSAIEASKKDFESSKKETITNISSVIYQTKESYYGILSSYQQVNLASESLKMDQLHLEQASEYFKAGVRTKIDVTDAKLKLSNSNLQLIQAKYALKNVKTKLISLLGIDNSETIEIKQDPDIQLLANNLQKKEFQLQDLVQIGLKNRAEVAFFEDQIAASQLKLESIKKEYYPSILAQVNYVDKNSDKIATLDSSQAIAGIYLKWDLYSGDSTKSSLQNSLATLNTLKQQLFQEKLKIKEEITAALLKVQESKESLDVALQNTDLAYQKYDLAYQRYQAGLNDLVEFNDSKLQYTQAKAQLINTYYSYLTSLAKMEFTIGKIY